MKSLTRQVFELAPPGGLFDETAIANLFPDRSQGARNALVHRAVMSGEVLRLRPGLYCLAEPFRKTHPHPFVVAAALHAPSHVSLESALRHHGLIPEAVREVASVTVARSRRYVTPLGAFSFRRVPASMPRAGVRAVEVAPGVWAFVAGPLRAVADLVYLRREVSWERDGLGFLAESLRIERDDLDRISWRGFGEIRRGIRNSRVGAYLDGLREELGR
jgi:hypothetical protein